MAKIKSIDDAKSLLAQMPQNMIECLAQVHVAPLKISLSPARLALGQELEALKEHVGGLNAECDAHDASNKKRSDALEARCLSAPEHLRATLQEMLENAFTTAHPASAELMYADARADEARAEEN